MPIRPGRGAASPRPDRRATVPIVVLVTPPLFFLVRELSICRTPAGCSGVSIGSSVVLAPLAVVAALLVARAAGTGRIPDWLAPPPDDATLAALGAIVGGLTLYVVAELLGLVPGWLGRLLAPVGVLLALPLAFVNAVVVGSARSLGSIPEGVRLAATAVGVALTGAWWYVLAASAAGWLARVNEPRD